ncbi:hypothetical protein D3C71_1949110 [compost metagenome]
MAAGDAALPQHQVGQQAQWQRGLGLFVGAFENQIGTEGTFHDVILPLVAGLGSDLTDANDPPLSSITVDTVRLKDDGPVNCVTLLLHSKLA